MIRNNSADKENIFFHPISVSIHSFEDWIELHDLLLRQQQGWENRQENSQSRTRNPVHNHIT
jgi:hypothetical protein